jgi:hypothetical protein
MMIVCGMAAKLWIRDVTIKFDSDRVRSNLLETSGWRVVHLTSTMDDLTLVAQLVPLFPANLIDWRLRSELSARASETSPR